VLARWHALTTMAANPLTADEQAQPGRARAGDFTGLSVPSTETRSTTSAPIRGASRWARAGSCWFYAVVRDPATVIVLRQVSLG
jgi:hypothetical protein